jgi:hypothetical protein
MSSLFFKVTGDPAFSMFNLSLREEWLNNKKFCHRLSDDEVSVSYHFTPFIKLWIRIRIGSGSELDPDSIGSMGPDPVSLSGSGSRRENMTHKNKKVQKFNFLKYWMFSFES